MFATLTQKMQTFFSSSCHPVVDRYSLHWMIADTKKGKMQISNWILRTEEKKIENPFLSKLCFLFIFPIFSSRLASRFEEGKCFEMDIEKIFRLRFIIHCKHFSIYFYPRKKFFSTSKPNAVKAAAVWWQFLCKFSTYDFLLPNFAINAYKFFPAWCVYLWILGMWIYASKKFAKKF